MIDKAKISQSNNFIKRQCLCCRVAKYSKYKSAIPSYDINRYRYYGRLKDGRDVYLYFDSVCKYIYIANGPDHIAYYRKISCDFLKYYLDENYAKEIIESFDILYAKRCPCKC